MSEPRWATWTDLDPLTLHDLVRLRVDVFVVEQQCAYPELDGRDVDPRTWHVWLPGDAGGPGVAAYLRVLSEPDGSHRVGRVVTHPSARGAGLASTLVEAVLARLGEDAVVTLEAQSHLVGWYARLGFEVAGEDYVEDGIPHTPMRRAAGG